MTLLSDPSFLYGLGELLVVLGVVGQVSLFAFPEGRRTLERSLGLLFTVVVISGGGLIWRAEVLRNADRQLTPAQEAVLGKAFGQLGDVKFEVLTARTDHEAHALALKILNAIKAGGGKIVLFDEASVSPEKGVVLVVNARDGDLGRAAVATIGRTLMGARIAVIADSAPELDDRTLRIVVGGKP